jgi:hypothetical protein
VAIGTTTIFVMGSAVGSIIATPMRMRLWFAMDRYAWHCSDDLILRDRNVVLVSNVPDDECDKFQTEIGRLAIISLTPNQPDV